MSGVWAFEEVLIKDCCEITMNGLKDPCGESDEGNEDDGDGGEGKERGKIWFFISGG